MADEADGDGANTKKAVTMVASNGHRRRRHVCLFGISGDPPTGTAGHVGIVRQLLNIHKDYGWDEIRILPVYRHSFQEKRDRLVSFEHRLEMCRVAFRDLEDKNSNVLVVVSDVERQAWNRLCQKTENNDCTMIVSGTVHLLDYLLESEPETSFSFCLGADSFISLMQGQWQENDRVLGLLKNNDGKWIVVNRPNSSKVDTGVENSAKEEPQQEKDGTSSMIQNHDQLRLIQFIEKLSGDAILLPQDPALGNVSSTDLRQWLGNRDSSSSEKTQDPCLILPTVLQYIRQHDLYKT